MLAATTTSQLFWKSNANAKVFCSISNYIIYVVDVKLRGSKNTCIGNLLNKHTERMGRVDVQDARSDNYITARRVPVSSTAVGKSVNG